MRIILVAALIGLSFIATAPRAAGQQAPGVPPANAQASAPIDLTGYWVAFITEDWRFRMISPPKGDYTRIPLTEQGLKIANAWDPAADEVSGNQCKAYGAAAIMRMPSRFHISWRDANTLQVDSDAGMQTRLLHFGARPSSPGARTWQGYSAAEWEKPASLKVATTNMRSGYLRKNGVPYSESAAVTEYFDLAPVPNGSLALLVTTIVDDPQYLQQTYIVTSQFKKEADGSKWQPTPCTTK